MELTALSFRTHAAELALSRAVPRQQRSRSSATTHSGTDSITTNGEHGKQRASSVRLSIKKLGSSLLSHDKRSRSSFGGSSNGRSSQLTAIQRFKGDEEGASDPHVGGRRSEELESFGRAKGRAGASSRGSQGKMYSWLKRHSLT
jgi:hypothetical protein